MHNFVFNVIDYNLTIFHIRICLSKVYMPTPSDLSLTLELTFFLLA